MTISLCMEIFVAAQFPQPVPTVQVYRSAFYSYTEHLEIHFLNVFLIVIFLFAHPETSLCLKQGTIRGNGESSQKTPCIYHPINLPVRNPGDCSKLLNICR